jgi:hypothetical protein
MELAGPNAKDPALADDIKLYVSVVAPNARMAGIAFPGTFMLERSGRVKARFFEDFYLERNTVSSIMIRLGGGATLTGTKVATEHLDITTYSSDSAIAPGDRVTLAFDVVPRRGIHVYAPGASSYRLVTVNLESHPQIRALPMKYPASQIYVFKPLNERVPVYQKPFTLLQEIVVAGTPQAQAALRGKDSLTLNGTLEYQACDDRVCFNPESVPMSWTFMLRPIDRPVRPQ